jgi:uncharacterized protein
VLGLGLGLSASELLQFYQQQGPKIFDGNGSVGWIRRWFRAKYDSQALRRSLSEAFGSKRLGDSRKRLVIPSFNVETGEVHVWKTAHHPRLEHDYTHSAVEVALSTAAAPTYFPTFEAESGTPLIDGGVWPNNPVAIAAVEAIGVLGWQPSNLRILSLGCTTAPFELDWGRKHSLRMLGWATKLTDLFMTVQSVSATGMVQHLLTDRHNLVRISPTAGKNRFDLTGRTKSRRSARSVTPRHERLFLIFAQCSSTRRYRRDFPRAGNLNQSDSRAGTCPSRCSKPSRCPNPSEPYCPEHDVELHYHTWVELRDMAHLSQREDKARKTRKLVPFPPQHALKWPL